MTTNEKKENKLKSQIIKVLLKKIELLLEETSLDLPQILETYHEIQRLKAYGGTTICN